MLRSRLYTCILPCTDSVLTQSLILLSTRSSSNFRFLFSKFDTMHDWRFSFAIRLWTVVLLSVKPSLCSSAAITRTLNPLRINLQMTSGGAGMCWIFLIDFGFVIPNFLRTVRCHSKLSRTTFGPDHCLEPSSHAVNQVLSQSVICTYRLPGSPDGIKQRFLVVVCCRSMIYLAAHHAPHVLNWVQVR